MVFVIAQNVMKCLWSRLDVLATVAALCVAGAVRATAVHIYRTNVLMLRQGACTRSQRSMTLCGGPDRG